MQVDRNRIRLTCLAVVFQEPEEQRRKAVTLVYRTLAKMWLTHDLESELQVEKLRRSSRCLLEALMRLYKGSSNNNNSHNQQTQVKWMLTC